MRHVHRLGEEILGAELHRFHRGLDVALPGQQDHRRALTPQPLEHDEPVRVGEVQVEQHHVGAHAVERVHRLLAGAVPPHFVADALEVVPDGADHIGIIVDEQQRISHDEP